MRNSRLLLGRRGRDYGREMVVLGWDAMALGRASVMRSLKSALDMPCCGGKLMLMSEGALIYMRGDLLIVSMIYPANDS